jgi:hypothetical protein
VIQHRKRARPKTVTIDPVRANKRFFLPVYKDPTATPEALGPLPATYGECQEARRGTKEVPCTYLRCKHHMASNVREGKYRPGKPRMATINVIHPRADEPYVPDLGVFSHTCVLAFVDDQPADTVTPYTVIAELLGCTQQRIQHIVDHALSKLAPFADQIAHPDD